MSLKGQQGQKFIFALTVSDLSKHYFVGETKLFLKEPKHFRYLQPMIFFAEFKTFDAAKITICFHLQAESLLESLEGGGSSLSERNQAWK